MRRCEGGAYLQVQEDAAGRPSQAEEALDHVGAQRLDASRHGPHGCHGARSRRPARYAAHLLSLLFRALRRTGLRNGARRRRKTRRRDITSHRRSGIIDSAHAFSVLSPGFCFAHLHAHLHATFICTFLGYPPPRAGPASGMVHAAVARHGGVTSHHTGAVESLIVVCVRRTRFFSPHFQFLPALIFALCILDFLPARAGPASGMVHAAVVRHGGVTSHHTGARRRSSALLLNY